MLASCLHAREEPPRATIPSGAHGRELGRSRGRGPRVARRPRYGACHQATGHVSCRIPMIAQRQRSPHRLILGAGVRTNPTSGLPRAGRESCARSPLDS